MTPRSAEALGRALAGLTVLVLAGVALIGMLFTTAVAVGLAWRVFRWTAWGW